MSASENGFEVDAQIKAYKYRSQINFVEFNNDGYSPKSMPIMSLIHNKDKKYRRVEVYFTFNDKKEVQTAFVGMINADEYDNPTSERFILLLGPVNEIYVFAGLPCSGKPYALILFFSVMSEMFFELCKGFITYVMFYFAAVLVCGILGNSDSDKSLCNNFVAFIYAPCNFKTFFGKVNTSVGVHSDIVFLSE